MSTVVKPTAEQIGALLALKANERPEAGYWQDFLCEFHQKQREQAVRTTGLRAWYNQAAGWFSDLGPSKWAYGMGVAYAAATAAFILTPREAMKENVPVSPVNYQVVPASIPPAIQQLNQLDLSPSTQGTPGEQVF